jgi:two-component system, chemotaxis family, chemotaxis protein CheY
MTAEPGKEPDVLIVEDQDDVRESLADLLMLEGYRVATAANGQEALAQLRSQPLPHVILLDLRMPVMDGRTFRKEQQGSPALAVIPVVVLSGEAEIQETAAALEAVGHLTKPVEIERLLTVVERFRG